MKDQALWLYQRLTARSRSRLMATLREQGNVPIAILFYHRVSDSYPNDWTLSCSDFAAHLDWLQENFDIVTLEEAQRRVRSEFCDRPTVSITFDDGYADNSDFAIPELARRNLPGTYFVSTDHIRTGKPFSHDLRVGQPLAINTIDDLRTYHQLGIEIGAHTRSHVDVGSLKSDADLRDEIVGSVQDLQRWLRQRIRYFAFPYGLPHNTSQMAVDIIHESGLEGFCTAYGAWNWPGNPGFHLRRIHGDPGLTRLKNWLSLDTRKLQDHQQLPFTEPGTNQLDLASELLAEDA